MRYLKKITAFSLILAAFLFGFTPSALAVGDVLGVHILRPSELEAAEKLIKPEERSDQENWKYLTIPLTLDDLEKRDEWQAFFDKARQGKVIPIVRLATRFEDGAWKVPNRKEIVDLISFLNGLSWPTEQKHLIVFNEVNHAKEWGGTVDPVSYVDTLRFASQWAHAEDANFVVLSAAMDLAAPTGAATQEAFQYLERMYQHDPEIFSYVDAWNSHSYPNPGFSASPTRTGQNSLVGFRYELDYLKTKTGRDYQVFITETGWEDNSSTSRWLESYYTYALQHIWSDPRIVAVTPFVLQGAPGPFAGFSFLDSESKPTKQYEALQAAMKKLQS